MIDPVRRNYANGLLADGHVEDADTIIAADLATLRSRGARGLPLANTLRSRARIEMTQGRYADAQRDLDEALAAWNGVGGTAVHAVASNPFVLDAAALQIARAEPAGALATLSRVARPDGQAATPLDVDQAAAGILSAQALLLLGRNDDARDIAQHAYDAIEHAPVRDYFQLLESDAALRLGQAQHRLGDLASARLSLEHAVALRSANDDPSASPWLAEADVALADCLVDLREGAAARDSLQAAARIDAAHALLGAQFREPLARTSARVTRLASR